MVYLVVVMVLWVVAIAAAIVIRRRSRTATPKATNADSPPDRPAAPPMTDLESALAKVTDRDGKTIRDRIDAESQHVDDLRVPDDTGPLLRRALDSVQPGDAAGESGTSGDTSDAPDT